MFKSFNEIRNLFIDFFKSKNHSLIKSSSLIPNDDSLLFTNAGMNQFKDIFLGLKKSLFKEVITIQRCLRVGGKHNDINNIGYTYKHNTFFEMMGNFSFNSYFKKEAILYAWELLTSKKWFNLNKNKLIITVNINDIETYKIWSDILNINKNNIFLVGKKCNFINNKSENFWQMSDFGPCGYSTEIYYNINSIINIKDFLLYKDTNKYLEIWNLVFVEYNIINDNNIIKLPYKSVDTGMGLERICSVLQNVNSNFNIDIFLKLKNKISIFLNIKINKKNIYIFNLISDHLRSIIYLIIDKVLPSNEYRGYVLRKIIRRTLTYIYLITKNKNCILNKLLYYIKDWFLNFYFFKKENIFLKIKNIVLNEEKKYFSNLLNNLNILNFYLKKKDSSNILDGNIVFLLYDTYGLSIDIIIEVCKYNNFKIDLKKFNYLLNLQKKKSNKFNIFNKYKLNFYLLNNINKTKFLGYYINYCYSKIICILYNNNRINYFDKYNTEIIIILSYTVLYPEFGGQICDRGIIYNNNFTFFVYNIKIFGEYIFHIGKLEYGYIKNNDIVKVKYDYNYRFNISCNHSACHILLYVLKNFFLKNIKKYSSLIKNNYFYLDFYYNFNLDNLKLYKINRKVNKIIWKKLYFYEENIKKNNLNKKFNFLSDNNIRIVNFGNLIKDYCCGTHVNNTYNINLFIIKKKYNISSKIIRIKACTNIYALKYINKNLFILRDIYNLLLTNKKNLYNKICSIKNNEIKNKNNNKLIYNILIKNILSQVLLKDIIKFNNNLNILVKRFFYNDFINEKILFNVINKLKIKFNIPLIIFILKLNNIDNLIFYVNKKILKNFNLNLINNKFIKIKKYKIIKNINFNVEFFNILFLDDKFDLCNIINFIKLKLLD